MISVAKIQSYLNVEGDNEYLATLEQSVIEELQTRTGRHLGPTQPFVDTLDGRVVRERLTPQEAVRRLPAVRLSQPVPDLDAVAIEERSSHSADWSVVAKETSDAPPRPVFELDGRWLFRLLGHWPPCRRCVRLSYDFGYEEDAGPAEFTGVALDLMAYRYVAPSMRSFGRHVEKAEIARTLKVTLNERMEVPQELQHRIDALRDGGLVG